MIYRFIFNLVMSALKFISKLTGFTYNEVNIIVFYILIPFSWMCLLDILYESYFFSILFITLWIGIVLGCRSFRSFCNLLYTRSIQLLLYFNRFGLNYERASVWICISVPIVIYIILINLTINSK